MAYCYGFNGSCLYVFYVTKHIGGHSRKYFIKQQKSLAKTEVFAEEMIYGQKVIKIFNHEDETLNGFNEVNETLFNDSKNAKFICEYLNACFS